MGSHPTLAHQQPAAEPHQLDPDDRTHHHTVTHLAVDHHDWNYDHHTRAEQAAEKAFDRLNPTFGVPADRADSIGHRDVAQRERALALGVRVAVHDSRQNDPNPHVWQPGQDYRMADAIHATRHQPTRAPWGPERTGPER